MEEVPDWARPPDTSSKKAQDHQEVTVRMVAIVVSEILRTDIASLKLMVRLPFSVLPSGTGLRKSYISLVIAYRLSTLAMNP